MGCFVLQFIYLLCICLHAAASFILRLSTLDVLLARLITGMGKRKSTGSDKKASPKAPKKDGVDGAAVMGTFPHIGILCQWCHGCA